MSTYKEEYWFVIANQFNTKTLVEAFQRCGVSNIHTKSVDEALEVVGGLLSNREELVGMASVIYPKLANVSEGYSVSGEELDEVVYGVEGFLNTYRDSLNATKSLLFSREEVLQSLPYNLSNRIFRNVRDKKVLAIPIPLDKLVEYLYQEEYLRGNRGLVIMNLVEEFRRVSNGVFSREVDIKRYQYYKTEEEGRRFFNGKLLTKGELYALTAQFPNAEGLVLYNRLYNIYLAEKVGIRNTKILSEKTGLFLDELRKKAPNLYNRVGNSDAFRKLRIFESDGYTLILRNHFVLIDEMRGTVIISKTPTNILKKDIELIIRLLRGE